MLDSTTAVGWAAAAITFTMAVFERLKNSKVKNKTAEENETLSLAKASEKLAHTHQQIAEEYKALLEKERSEHKLTRDYWHEENGKQQAAISAANLQVLELQDRPDMRDVLNILTTLTKGIEKILEILANKP